MKLSTVEVKKIRGEIEPEPEKPPYGTAYAPYVRRAEANGIGQGTFDYRIYVLGWDRERACTEPVGMSMGLTKEMQRKRGLRK